MENPLVKKINSKTLIRRISSVETLPLRQSILRPHLALTGCIHDGDDKPETRHFGAFLEGRLVGVASLFDQPFPSSNGSKCWRLRGMAVEERQQCSGIGGRLLEACIDEINILKGEYLWCYARISATKFYLRYQFEIAGEEFNFPEVGPVVLMVKQMVV